MDGVINFYLFELQVARCGSSGPAGGSITFPLLRWTDMRSAYEVLGSNISVLG